MGVTHTRTARRNMSPTRLKQAKGFLISDGRFFKTAKEAEYEEAYLHLRNDLFEQRISPVAFVKAVTNNLETVERYINAFKARLPKRQRPSKAHVTEHRLGTQGVYGDSQAREEGNTVENEIDQLGSALSRDPTPGEVEAPPVDPTQVERAPGTGPLSPASGVGEAAPSLDHADGAGIDVETVEQLAPRRRKSVPRVRRRPQRQSVSE